MHFIPVTISAFNRVTGTNLTNAKKVKLPTAVATPNVRQILLTQLHYKCLANFSTNERILK